MTRPKELTDAAIRAIWNRFGPEGQDMPFAQFRKELIDLFDPKKMMDDLSDIELRRARERLNRMRIRKALEN